MKRIIFILMILISMNANSVVADNQSDYEKTILSLMWHHIDHAVQAYYETEGIDGVQFHQEIYE
ncbi:hypothetical protein [Tenuibacillus multivorans]|uniref:Uncharacterized protein n=1 Tax=Tenuibacillus multivorans TaxID=237069 RepID=A0A1H0AWH4_9BACI|nr:hypothetical protein [Tenuibacillus multivorans]GEL77802.1 hypothetical protein TMU01_20370 [Tenuibacillus multivorans]SDN37393.1 hypothetical protein SAMN05216498_2093 [Tenuibacillus multivorans]